MVVIQMIAVNVVILGILAISVILEF